MTADFYTTGQVAKLLGVSARRVRQMRAEGKLPFVLDEGGSASYPQAAVLALRRRKTGVEGRKSEGGSFGGSQGGSVVDLRDLPGLAEMIEAAVMAAVPKAIEAATSADRIAREQAQAALFEANARVAAAEARAFQLEAQVQELTTKRKFFRRR